MLSNATVIIYKRTLCRMTKNESTTNDNKNSGLLYAKKHGKLISILFALFCT